MTLLHCFLWENGSKHGWHSLQKETKRIKKISERNPTLFFGFYSSSFLCPILISDMLKVINIQENSQSKELLKLVLFPFKTYIKLRTEPGQIISRESLLNNITLFFSVWWFRLQLFQNRTRRTSKYGCYFILNTSCNCSLFYHCQSFTSLTKPGDKL